MEEYLLGEKPTLTRVQVAEQAGMNQTVAEELWRLLGFPQQTDEAVAFTEADVQALRETDALMRLGILSPDSQAALVRTWGRSFARLAEWETTLLANVATAGPDPDPEARLTELAAEVLPRVESLQTYVWRRHLAASTSRMFAVQSVGATKVQLAVCFVDIVGYTSQSKSLDEAELVSWLENFESETTGLVVDHGGRIIKTIGDEVLFVADDIEVAAEIALKMVEKGADEDDFFPAVRAGVAYGEVVNRLGDVYGPTVNIASRLTSVARPGSVLVDAGAYEQLSGRTSDADGDERESDPGSSAFRFRRMRRTSVKGYSRLQSWVLRRG
ncbi:adenylate/guanylate cyclase domain-containing protein [Nocardioides sp. KIGAM211]|uniref:Adenylate/guanylate cyclase domain-containing protein n=1 Tax=Nocardioides luti TaxID=2761101 RepID=A0A7X0VAY8_9ACTN|nr:adenylate/guanylate cyclase domain-containing protein [Nocardioides luti]